MYTHSLTHVHINVHTHAHTQIHTNTHKYTHTHTPTHKYTHTHNHASTHIRMQNVLHIHSNTHASREREINCCMTCTFALFLSASIRFNFAVSIFFLRSWDYIHQDSSVKVSPSEIFVALISLTYNNDM